ncbi:M14 family zinc carboxypeptidase [Fangia hongkongensis]|nr:succinylglutamate desuccinylase/aspartoacylase family protein [Fangia hongkongensis]
MKLKGVMMGEIQYPSYITKSKLKVGQNAYGEDLFVTVIQVDGSDKNAPSVYIQASMHGAEIQGNAVIFELLKHFSEKRPNGNITIVPQCNPVGGTHRVGAAHQGRFDPMSGDNWNRYYFYPNLNYDALAKSYVNKSEKEYKVDFRKLLLKEIEEALSKPYLLTRAKYMAYRLQSLAYKADIVLDLHTDNNAITYLYSPSYTKNTASYFGYSDVILIENTFGGALDEAIFSPWWHLQQALEKEKYNSEVCVESYTLELGSEEVISKSLAIEQVDGILNYFYHKGVMSGSQIENKVNYCEISNFKTIYAEMGGLYEWYVHPGEFIKKGMVIGRVIQPSYAMEVDVLAPVSGKIASVSNKGALPQNSHLLNIFTQ